ncbi:hypothetical protein ABW21_db0206749 [Orbilia brochopaga]|nr:hypothetical protein ABW21_db0206749 [Drechslerella brochopaga]
MKSRWSAALGLCFLYFTTRCWANPAPKIIFDPPTPGTLKKPFTCRSPDDFDPNGQQTLAELRRCLQRLEDQKEEVHIEAEVKVYEDVGGPNVPDGSCITFSGQFGSESQKAALFEAQTKAVNFELGDTPHWTELKKLQATLAGYTLETAPIYDIPTRMCKMIYCNGDVGVGMEMCNASDTKKLTINALWMATALGNWLLGAMDHCVLMDPPPGAAGFRRETWAISWLRSAPTYGINITPCAKGEDRRDLTKVDGPMELIGFF